MTDLYEHRKLCAARYAWQRRNLPCPNPMQNGVRPTWAQWWARMYGNGETLAQYATRMAGSGHNAAPQMQATTRA